MMHNDVTCWLVGDHDRQFPLLIQQFARLRRVRRASVTVESESFAAIPASRGSLVAAGISCLDEGFRGVPTKLGSIAERGGTIYIRGGFRDDRVYSLEPLARVRFRLSRCRQASSYRFTDNDLVPHALRNEEAPHNSLTPSCEWLDGEVKPIALAKRDDGEGPVIFTLKSRGGTIICDLNDDERVSDVAIAERLADPETRLKNIGALVAIDSARGQNPSHPVPFNLTVDDRPINFDFLNVHEVENFLNHVAARNPSAHIDFAWTPADHHPSRKYLDILKKFRTGFVWHGFLHHVDHRELRNPEADMLAGQQLVHTIARKFGVRWQPVMIFPYEKFRPESLAILARAGFLATVATPDSVPNVTAIEPFTERSVVVHHCSRSGLPILHRHNAGYFSRNRMLAYAALGNPILAGGHPRDLGMQRLDKFRNRRGGISHFDHILDFAAEKGLPSRSLEEIASHYAT